MPNPESESAVAANLDTQPSQQQEAPPEQPIEIKEPPSLDKQFLAKQQERRQYQEKLDATMGERPREALKLAIEALDTEMDALREAMAEKEGVSSESLNTGESVELAQANEPEDYTGPMIDVVEAQVIPDAPVETVGPTEAEQTAIQIEQLQSTIQQQQTRLEDLYNQIDEVQVFMKAMSWFERSFGSTGAKYKQELSAKKKLAGKYFTALSSAERSLAELQNTNPDLYKISSRFLDKVSQDRGRFSGRKSEAEQLAWDQIDQDTQQKAAPAIQRREDERQQQADRDKLRREDRPYIAKQKKKSWWQKLIG